MEGLGGLVRYQELLQHSIENSSILKSARAHVRALKLKSKAQWDKYLKSVDKHPEIPAHPDRTYKKQWKGLGDWLGTGTIANADRKFLDFEAARAHVRALKLKSKAQWNEYSKSGRIPPEIPYHPDRTYKKQWKGYGDWLGTELLQHSIENI